MLWKTAEQLRLLNFDWSNKLLKTMWVMSSFPHLIDLIRCLIAFAHYRSPFRNHPRHHSFDAFFVPLNFLGFCSCIFRSSGYTNFNGNERTRRNVVARKTWPKASGCLARMSNDSTLKMEWAEKSFTFLDSHYIGLGCEASEAGGVSRSGKHDIHKRERTERTRFSKGLTHVQRTGKFCCRTFPAERRSVRDDERK